MTGSRFDTRVRGNRWIRSAGTLLLCLLASSWVVPTSQAEDEGSAVGNWFRENFEVHGFLRSTLYMRTPDFHNEVNLSSWRNEINLEMEARLYEGDDFRTGLYAVFRPVYDAIYELQTSQWGARTKLAQFGTAPAFPDDTGHFATKSGKGQNIPGGGGQIKGEFTLINSDTGSLFTGEPTAAVSIDDVVFFGRVTAPWRPRGSLQDNVGGNATGNDYADLRDNFGALLFPGSPTNPLANAGLPAGTGLDASLAMASQPLSTPLNAYQGGIGNQASFRYGSVDMNRTTNELAFDCRDNAHPWCFIREAYAELEWKRTFVRVGKQQIVWGKTDAFRLQDKINPIDLSYHNVFPDLEERRIPTLALDMIQGFGDVGPLQDVSLEFAWVFDRFIPDQFGQCGEPYAFTAACESRADAGGHSLFNFSLAGVDTVDWTFKNTEPGLRLEFRIPKPSIAFSLSAFYNHQDIPVARFQNFYSVENPNPASMLFLQGIADGTGTPVAATIDTLSGIAAANPNAPAPYSGGVWLSGFDPYAHAGKRGPPVDTLAAANGDLQNAWYMLTNVLQPAQGGCAGLTGQDLANCGGAIAAFALPWTASEAVLEYPRILSLGASLDYQIPGIDTVLRLELAGDINRGIQNTARIDQVSKRNVFQAAIGLDRSTFIPFLNRNRTAFISFQTFVEYISDYDGGRGYGEGMVPYETQVVSTFFMQNYWRNDSIVLTNLFAIDWQGGAKIWGPSLQWIVNQNFSISGGVNLLWGRKRFFNIRDVCPQQGLECLGDPTSWNDGNWQMLNAALDRVAEAPFWGRESFADKFMKNRDEFWIGATYQF